MQLSEHLNESLIKLELNGTTKYQIIEEMVDMIDANAVLKNKNTVLQDVIDREQYLSTGLENGLAVPHGKTKGIDKLSIAFGIAKNGVEFDSLDGKKTTLIFLLISPKDTSGPHIQALAQITRKLRSAEVRESLLKAATADEVIALFKTLDAE